MGVRAAVFVCVSSFLLGALFTHWIADSLTLWKSPVTDEHLWTAAAYYHILANGPSELRYFFAAVIALGGVTILWSLNDLRAGNIMFDGGSIFLFGTTLVMYLNTVLPTIFSQFSTLPAHELKDAFPPSLRATTLDLASNHLVCSVALTGVIALQAGRFFAEKADEDDGEYVMVDSADAEESSRPSTVPVSRAKTPDHDHIVRPLRVETTD
ncbi:hypothetical protein D9611_004645 [Ephemerocybe angulata]|uniref:Shr3 amino acid permease chaperone n=1 Tax=Ephemerocybe angulata TaxID=980116 RepID=A0A8H5B2W4_9AGAR|nr:hypothetical protein D9611_004645 [Tulosesus angulatus]